MAPFRSEATYALTNGAVEATPAFYRKDALLVSPALVTFTKGKMMLQSENLRNHTYTLEKCAAVENVKLITPHLPAITKLIPQQHLILMNSQPAQRENKLSRLFHEQTETDIKRW